MGVGIYVQLKIGDFVELSTIKYVTGSILIIVVGAFIAIVAFFGCCGAVKENTCFLGTVSISAHKAIFSTTVHVCSIGLKYKMCLPFLKFGLPDV
jgi:hypothetical protein